MGATGCAFASACQCQAHIALRPIVFCVLRSALPARSLPFARQGAASCGRTNVCQRLPAAHSLPIRPRTPTARMQRALATSFSRKAAQGAARHAVPALLCICLSSSLHTRPYSLEGAVPRVQSWTIVTSRLCQCYWRSIGRVACCSGLVERAALWARARTRLAVRRQHSSRKSFVCVHALQRHRRRGSCL